MKKSRTSWIILVASELSAILFVGTMLFQRMNFYATSVTFIRKKTVSFSQTAALSYFYELNPNSVVSDNDQWLPKTARQTINADGLNERYDYTTQKMDDVFRIITLGDSFTYGMYVNTEDNWPEKLEDALNSFTPHKFEVINIGVPGYDLTYAAELFMRKGKKYNPDLVIWLLNDDSRKINEVMVPVNNACASLRKRVDEYDVIQQDGSVNHPCSAQAMQAVIKKMSRTEVLEYQMTAVSKIISHDMQYSLALLNFPRRDPEFSDMLVRYVTSKERVYFYDRITDVSTSAQFHLPDGHPNANGHLLIANDIFNYLRKNQLIPL